MAGAAVNPITTNFHFEVIKFDSEASIEWLGLYGSFSTDRAYGVSESQDGGYLVTGYTRSYGDTLNRSVVAMKLSSTG